RADVEPLAQLHGSGAMVDSDQEEGHGTLRVDGWQSTVGSWICAGLTANCQLSTVNSHMVYPQHRHHDGDECTRGDQNRPPGAVDPAEVRLQPRGEATTRRRR